MTIDSAGRAQGLDARDITGMAPGQVQNVDNWRAYDQTEMQPVTATTGARGKDGATHRLPVRGGSHNGTARLPRWGHTIEHITHG
jgi:hypothetical protein